VESGVPLSRALADSHYILGTFARNLIRIGEASGTLPENLEYVAVELKTKHELRKQLIQAMIYPAIIIMATVVISVFLIVVIFPKIIPIFQSVHSTLPWSTRALMATSYVLIHYGWWLLFTVVIGLGVLRFSQRSTVIRQVTERGFLRVPVVGKLISSYQIALGCRTFGILLASEVRITEAVSIVSQSTEHTLYREAWIQIGTRVATGQRLSSEILRYPVLFPMIVVQMIQAGETTGTLSDALGFLAAIYESDVRDITKNLTTLLEPLLMLVMGLMVGFIAVSIITPIYGITQYLHA
jgi:type II secretory pathway component PulF